MPFLDDTSCNLASINIYKFYNADTDHFDIEGYLHIIHLVQLSFRSIYTVGTVSYRGHSKKDVYV